jgi:SpoVK/Ycf46/Vps4 family AAA+-type ATPase
VNPNSTGIRMIFQRARAEAPCVLILEDLDSLINNQNRAFFLNEVDGLEDNDGLLLVSCFRFCLLYSAGAPRTPELGLFEDEE